MRRSLVHEKESPKQPKCRGSFRKAVLIVEQFRMVDIGTLQEFSRTLTNGVDCSQHRVAFAAATECFEAFANGLRHGGSHGFSGFARQLLREPVGIRICDVGAYLSTLIR